MEKIMKEKDKLEKQALVLRMQKRDAAKKEMKDKDDGEQPSQCNIDELRKKAREKYLQQREVI